MLRRLLLATTLVAVATAGVLSLTAATTDEPHKVFVCKYVGTPGVDERLQTGDNPISVDIHTLSGPVVIGAFFADAQGRSKAIAFDTGQEEPDCEPDVVCMALDCPPGDDPPDDPPGDDPPSDPPSDPPGDNPTDPTDPGATAAVAAVLTPAPIVIAAPTFTG